MVTLFTAACNVYGPSFDRGVRVPECLLSFAETITLHSRSTGVLLSSSLPLHRWGEYCC